MNIVILTTDDNAPCVSYLVQHLNVKAIFIDEGASIKVNTECFEEHDDDSLKGRIKRSLTNFKKKKIKKDPKVALAYLVYQERKFLDRLESFLPKNMFLSNINNYSSFGDWDFIKNTFNVPIHRVGDINTSESKALVESYTPDLGIIYGGRVVKEHILSIPKKGFINKHSSMLPKQRGLAAEFWSLYHEDFDSLGVTIHFATPKLDGGKIVHQKKMMFYKGDNHHSLRFRSHFVGRVALVEAVNKLKDEDFVAMEQDESIASKNSKPKPEDYKSLAKRLPELWKKYGKDVIYEK